MADWVSGLTIDIDAQRQLGLSVAVIALIWLSRHAILHLVHRKITDTKTLYQWNKTTGYVAGVLTVLLVGRIWFDGFHSITTFLGLLSAGLAIALQSLILNLAGWVFILWRKPFEVGDRVEIGANIGDVIDVRLFQFSLMEVSQNPLSEQSTGRIVHVPNGNVFSQPVCNYSGQFPYIWNEIGVLVTFESDWEAAKSILQHIGQERCLAIAEQAEHRIAQSRKRFMIYYSKLTPVVYTSVVDSGVLLTLRHLCAPRQRRGMNEAIWEDILHAFAEHDDIDFAYPTRRVYDNVREGKPGARAE